MEAGRHQQPSAALRRDGQGRPASSPGPAISLSSDPPVRILVVDDDRELCWLIKEYLEPLGYQVTSAHTGPEGLQRALAGNLDAVILDVMLPGLDGFEVLKRLRAQSQVPVLMLTAEAEETDRIVGLEFGADDYLPKTFSTRELLARLRAVTRRAPGPGEQAPVADRRQSPAPPPPPVHVPAGRARLPKSIVRTTSPTRYWILVDLELPPLETVEPRPVTLVAMSASLRGGGLLFDPKPWVAAGAGVLAVSALLWFPFVRSITQSISQMRVATDSIAQGRFDVRVDATRSDELGALGVGINQMAVRLAGFVTGQKRFLGSIAHELCSPLARLQVSLGILEQRATDAQRPYVDVAGAKAGEIASLVNELLSFSKASLVPANLTLAPVLLLEVVQKAASRERDGAAAIEIDVPDTLAVQADAELLLRALSNLLRNAIAYAGHAGPIRVAARFEGKAVLLTVSDCGPGIPDDQLDKVFEPFYRLDSSRDRGTGGVGFGLTIVKTCIESCGGHVRCRNRQPNGLEVVVRLNGAPARD